MQNCFSSQVSLEESENLFNSQSFNLLVFRILGASPTMRDTGRGLRAEQWARYCGRYICADVIEKYARNQLLSRTASYGNWGAEPELGKFFFFLFFTIAKLLNCYFCYRFTFY